MEKTVIVTTGASLYISNLSRLSRGDLRSPPDNATALVEAFNNAAWSEVARELEAIGDPTAKICGAEINAIEELRRKGRFEIGRLVFLVSDTEIGQATGAILKSYFRRRRDLEFSKDSIQVETILDLQDRNPEKFRTHGLRNLVRVIGELIGRYGRERIVLEATGGYKAQIAFAVVIGQALKIPVYYKFEGFQDTIIDFPPLPVSLNFDLLAENADLLFDLERDELLTSAEIGEIHGEMRALVQEVAVDAPESQTLYALSPIGQIYLWSFRARHPKAPQPVEPSRRLGVKFSTSQHHYPDGFKEFARKVYDETPWITRVHDIEFLSRQARKRIGFKVRSSGDVPQLIGHYDYGQFRLLTSDESLDSLTWAADTLNHTYRA